MDRGNSSLGPCSSPPESTRKVAVVMLAYNAEKTLARTYADIPLDFVDDIILVDDASRDRTVEESDRIKGLLGGGRNGEPE